METAYVFVRADRVREHHRGWVPRVPGVPRWPPIEREHVVERDHPLQHLRALRVPALQLRHHQHPPFPTPHTSRTLLVTHDTFQLHQRAARDQLGPLGVDRERLSEVFEGEERALSVLLVR